MGSKQTRRDFIKNCTKYGCEFCLLSVLNNKLFAADNFIEQDIIDLSHLSYCGIDCEKCDLFKATKENDVEQDPAPRDISRFAFPRFGHVIPPSFDFERDQC